jgi:hypothetical protein
METPVSACWLASAAVRPADGRLTQVEGLADKVSIAARWAPGVTTFLVAAEQEDEARALAATVDPPLAIVGATDLGQAFDHVFPRLRTEGPATWLVPENAVAAAQRLARIATEGPPLLDWGAVERPARMLSARFAPGSKEHENATWAVAIARRHQGKRAPLPWFDVETDPERAAHRLQAAADVGSGDLQTLVERARHLLSNGGAARATLSLLGAIGRAEAALRRYPAALEASLAAVGGWREQDHLQEVGRPLCEALRIAGLTVDMERLPRIAAEAEALLEGDERIDGETRSFLRLALGRAWVQAGIPERGLPYLVPDAGTSTRLHVDWSTRRWRATALGALGRTHEAAGLRKTLFDEEREGISSIVLLARLDELLETAADEETLTKHLLLLAGLDPSIERLRGHGGSPHAAAQIVAREYAY